MNVPDPDSSDQPAHPGWLIELPSCPSTNSWMLQHAEALTHGACVWTRQQTAGRGRDGNRWRSPPGVLTASILLDLSERIDTGCLALACGLAVAHAVEDVAPAARVRLKWPNDCYLGDRKLAGLLCERPDAGRRGQRAVVVVGIGLNVDPRWDEASMPAVAAAAGAAPDARATAADGAASTAAVATAAWPAGCAGPASLAEVIAPVPTMPALLVLLRRYLLEAAGYLAAGGWERLLPALRERDWLAGREIGLQAGNERVEGQAQGLDRQGRLLVATSQGPRAFSSGRILWSRVPADGD